MIRLFSGGGGHEAGSGSSSDGDGGGRAGVRNSWRSRSSQLGVLPDFQPARHFGRGVGLRGKQLPCDDDGGGKSYAFLFPAAPHT